MRGLRTADATRHGDLVVLDFFAEGKHIVIDAVVTTVFINTTLYRVATIPGYAATYVEEKKFLSYKNVAEPIDAIHGGSQVLVRFAVEDGGRLGVHTQGFLRVMATVALEKDMRPPFAYRAKAPSALTLTSMWVQIW